MIRRYHHSPSIPFHIARVECLQEPVGAPLMRSRSSGAAVTPNDHQKPLENAPTDLRAFLWSLWVAGIAVGAGLALELNGLMHQGLWTQAVGFFVAGVAVIRKPGDGES